MTIETLDLVIVQGDDFTDEIIPTEDYFVWKTITAISRAAPVLVTSAAHGIVNNLPFTIESVGGMTEINTDQDTGLCANGQPEYFASNITANTVEINDVNSLGFTVYTSGGVLKYKPAIDLTGYSARLKAKYDYNDTVAIIDASTVNGKLVINTTTKRIAFALSAAITSVYDFDRLVYDLELVSASGIVVKTIRGGMTLLRQVTT